MFASIAAIIVRVVEQKGKKSVIPALVCGYLADRDYIAALNIYRVYQERRKKRFSLKHSKPVLYMAAGIPLNRPCGDSTQLCIVGR